MPLVLIDSHHDIIISSVTLPVSNHKPVDEDLVIAPKVDHCRHRNVWSEEGIKRFEEEVSHKLSDLRLRWLNPLSRTSLSILLETTNNILNTLAADHNRALDLNEKVSPKANQSEILKDC